jgi:hypothetical protein
MVHKPIKTDSLALAVTKTNYQGEVYIKMEQEKTL